MNHTSFARTLVAALFFFPAWCDTGLMPLNEPAGISGVIRFKNWPPADSVRELRLVAFETYPNDSLGILAALLGGRAAVYPELSVSGGLPKFVDALNYSWTTKQGVNLQLKKYDYFVVAQQYGPNILSDWRPAGVYSTVPNSFEPAPVRLLLHRILPNIDIQVDFHNPPPKPW